MKRMLGTLVTALAVAAAMPAKAEGFEGTILAGVSVSETKTKITDSTFGAYQLGIAYRFPLEKAGLDLRAHLDFLSLNGKTGTSFAKGNLNPMFGVDIHKTVGNWAVYGGIMGIKWNQNSTGNATLYPAASLRSDSPKLGYRIGTEYHFTPKVAVQVGLNQAECNVRLNPTWLTAGVLFKL